MTVSAAGRDPSPRALFCIIAEAHADIGAADDACEGRFRECGRTITLGLPPDWQKDPVPEDPEWRVAWHKLYVGLDLAHAYEQTGDERYSATWRTLVTSFTGQIGPTDESDGHLVARRILNTLYAWDRFHRASERAVLSADQARAVWGHLRDQVHFVRHHLTPTLNHRTIELTALVLAALAFPEFDGDGALLRFALAELERSAREDLHPDGVHVEASTHYHALFVRNFMAVRCNLARHGERAPSALDDLLRRAARFLLHVTRPDRTLVAFSDADTGRYDDVLALAAESLQCPQLRWVASGGREGAPPPPGADFPHGGYFVQRSHWTDTPEPAHLARHLVWDCGPLGRGVHGHYDMLHFEISADGRPLVVDPGRYTYAEGEPNWRHHFKSTAAHNTIAVDELDQCDYQPWNMGDPPPRIAHARCLGRWRDAALDVLAGEVRSPCYDAVHRRLIAMIHGRWWLVVDRLDATERHRYALRFQLTPAAHGAVSIHGNGPGRTIASPGLDLVIPGTPRIDIERGWVAPKYGVKHPAPRVRRRIEGSNVTMMSLLIPRHGARSNPILESWTIDRTDTTGEVVVRIDGIAQRVRWRLPSTEEPAPAPVSLM